MGQSQNTHKMVYDSRPSNHNNERDTHVMTAQAAKIPADGNLSNDPAQPAKPGWRADLRLGYVKQQQRTVLKHRQQLGPLTVQRPFYPEGETCHTYLLHPPGGVVGGDELQLQVTCHEQAHALLTTPGAAKFYRSAGATAQVSQHFTVAADGLLEWLPQENIYFP